MSRTSCAWLLLLGLLLPIVGCSSSPDPADRFAAFADALQRKDAHAAAAQTNDPAATEAAITAMFDGMGEAAAVKVSAEPEDSDEAGATLKYQWSWGEGHEFGYDTTGTAAKTGDDWLIAWTPTLLHPDLRDGLKFQYSTDSDLQTPVLDRTGQPLMTWQTVGVVSLDRAHVGSAAPLAALLAPFDATTTADSISAQFTSTSDDRVTVMKLREDDLAPVRDQLAQVPGVTVAEQGELLTTDRKLSSPAVGGLMQLWHDRITKAAGWSVYLVRDKGAPAQRLTSQPPAPTDPMRTTLDLRLQLLAQQAVAQESRPAVVVAISGSTGGILAAAQNTAADPQGAIAFSGLYPPGSTFKTITTAAALEANLATPATPVACPGRLTIENRTIPNEDDFDLGTVPLASAFSHSCNTSMAALSDKLPADALTNTARAFGIGVDFTIPGLTTVTGRVPNADTAAQRVENGIGQGTVTVSPFGLAVAEASLAHGSTILPNLVDGEKVTADAASESLPPTVTGALRDMMRKTVTEGTASQLSDIPDLGGKTGTAEFGDGASPDTHAHGWFAGIAGDIAFATLVVGGDSSTPAVKITGDFLRSTG
ncbi:MULTISPECIES: penicillin-binding transpeptidase domain-containing protein [unclassified Mycolicibacterium]|uniref:penicillin-binding transpeptidase domain-containing protein n=1 Tax=unclassified Mycolicibacterium TaxID=2636767 RepID=UPI0012DDE39D|nr:MULTISPECIES: penicillin-binding transpeptidase domain-containing protein [unclassified Mycolicibacterium]MUL84283.1 penicillin-binding protein [Mycolicibacterium sp. CBMA 329]MUL89651.1 penicillin-binding protein [Mycolicibacterium sp. CBMA 331]MUL99826.1 penicillin-binding protein [Mycolicibacterium sp. CBMA 334]MUM28769.1 penicillin-binding protein [Mycolicibacterium sp. CBMA 295]MUM39166.1 penicillin-binding protein [Mycolicibacterium sp. CBMA 247]